MSSTTAKPNEPALIEPGEPMPAFDRLDQDGQRHRLGDYAGRWLVLYFYPRDATPGCTAEACQFRDALADLEQHGAAVLGVSADDAASHQRFAAKHALGFPLLVDPDATLCKAAGVWRQKKMYGQTFWGVVRTTYLIDPAGRVAQRWGKVKVPGHAEAVWEALARRRGGV